MSAAQHTKQRVLDAAITAFFVLPKQFLLPLPRSEPKLSTRPPTATAKQPKIWVAMKPKSKNCST